MQIFRGKQKTAKKVVIHGPAGIGKSTLAAQFPDPLFIDVEGSTKELDVARFDTPTTWEELLDMVRYVLANPLCCKTLIIDTADWAERLMIEYIIRVNKWKSLETPGYGKGYQYCAEEFGNLLALLTAVVKMGIHAVFTAHSKMRKFEQPDEMGAYDRWELKTTKQVAPLLTEWCDLLLFCNYRTYVIQTDGAFGEKKPKVQGGERVMYTTHNACWDAKNRQGLPEVLPLDYQKIAHLFEDSESGGDDVRKELEERMKKDGITVEDVQEVVAARGKYPAGTQIAAYSDKFIRDWVLRYWEQVVEMVREKANGAKA